MVKHSSGFVLIEALIALVVSAVGLLGIALISSTYLAESTSSKAKAEALKLAEFEIENLRSIAASWSVDSIENGDVSWPVTDSPYQGQNAEFTVSAANKAVSDGTLKATVLVSWDGGQTITLSTLVADDIFDMRAEGANQTGDTNSSFSIDLPTGGAEYGEDAPSGSLSENVSLDTVTVSTANGSLLLINNADDPNNEETLLTYTGSAFSEIRGIVYVPSGVLSNTAENYQSIIVKPSDTGVCPKGSPKSSGVGSDWFFEYSCFFGAGWYGNIAVQYYDSGEIDSDKEECVGDPLQPYVANNDLSNHPELILATDIKRAYRGYGVAYTIDNSGFQSVVANEDGAVLLVTQGLAEGEIYGYGDKRTEIDSDLQDLVNIGNHDFYISEDFVEDSQQQDCRDALSAVSGANPSYIGSFPGTASTGQGSFEDFSGNLGDFVCLRVNGQFSCPSEIPTSINTAVSTSIVSISGTVSGASGSSTALSTITSQFPSGTISKCIKDDSGQCTFESLSLCSNVEDGTSYSCQIYVVDGDSWSGTLSFTSEEKSVCSPSSGVYAVTVSAGSASLNSYDVELAEVCSSPPTFNYSVTITNTTNQEFSVPASQFLVIDDERLSCSPGLQEIIPGYTNDKGTKTYYSKTFSCNNLSDQGDSLKYLFSEDEKDDIPLIGSDFNWSGEI